MFKNKRNQIIMGILIVIIVGTMVLKGGHSTSTSSTVPLPNSPDDAASGDTNAESLKELTAEYQKVVQQNQNYQTQITQLLQAPSKNSQVLDQQLSQLEQQQKQSAQTIANLQQSVSQFNSGQNNASDSKNYPVQNNPATTSITTVSDLSAGATILSNPSSITSPSNNANMSGSTTQSPPPIPFYTIPALSNLAHTSLMTSLIGEVPQGNSFSQPPFPFQAIVGKKELLAANGISLPPQLAGMKISGYSVGVGSFVQGLACVRSYITKVLFVFDDGHFVVYGKDENTTSIDPNDTLGYLSDPFGNPCMQGKYISNAARVLAMLTGVGLVEGASQGLSQAQTTTMTGYEGTSTVFNGSTGKYAAGYGLSYSADKATDYALTRLKGTFDVVYIPASSNHTPTQVIANFTQTIPIDLDPTGRTIDEATQLSKNLTLHPLD